MHLRSRSCVRAVSRPTIQLTARLERLAGDEAHGLSLGNLDHGAGLRIARGARLAVRGLERAEADEGDRVTLLERRVMPSITDSMACAALLFVPPMSLATFAISSCLFI